MEMKNTKKTCDLPGEIAAELFKALNGNRIKISYVKDQDTINSSDSDMRIITDENPSSLIYPEGWYFAGGRFTNKFNSSSLHYASIIMVNSRGKIWDN